MLLHYLKNIMQYFSDTFKIKVFVVYKIKENKICLLKPNDNLLRQKNDIIYLIFNQIDWWRKK